MAEDLAALVKTTAEATAAVRGKFETFEAKFNETVSRFDKLDAIDKDTVDKASKDGAEALSGLRELQATLKAETWSKSLQTQQEQLDDIQKHLAMQPGGLVQTMPAAISPFEKSLGRSMRRPAAFKAGVHNVPIETIEAETTKLVNLYAPHLDDETKSHVVKTMIAGFDTEGGLWVPVDRVAKMVKRIFESNPMRQICAVMSTGTDMVEMVVDDNELSAVWGGELHTITDTETPQIGLVEIPVHELYARPLITLKMLEDSTIDIVGWLTEKATDRFIRTESTAFVIGNGSQKPLGFLQYPDYDSAGVYKRGAVEQVLSGADGGLGTSGEGIIRIFNSLKEAYQAGAVWLTKRANFFEFMRLRDLDGQYLFRFGDALAQGIGMTVFGKPLFFADDMEAFANDALAVAYGNFQVGYQIVDRMGTTVLVDPYSVDPKIRYRFRRRVGGRVVNFEAIKILKLAAP